MQQTRSITYQIEHLLFDFMRCVNELHVLHNELSLMEIDQIKQSVKLLRATIYEH